MSDHPSAPLVVVNADDFGASASVNAATVRAFASGEVSSATLLANLPGFEEACDLVRRHDLNGRVGVHLNLTQGPPLTDRARREAGVGEGGQLRLRARWRFSRAEATAVEHELRAQVERVLAMGITPTHLDAHHHAHTAWPVLGLVIRLARAYGIGAVRLARNCGPPGSPPRRLYRELVNRRLADAGLARTRYFGSAAHAAGLPPSAGPIEVMVHPDLGPDGELQDITRGATTLSASVAPWRGHASLVSYGELIAAGAARA